MQAPTRSRSRLGRLGAALALCMALAAPATAFAGEVKFGAEPLQTDDSGKITAAGKKAAANEIPSVPGEELWTLHLWARIDKGGPGPLYVEFFGKLSDGKRYLAYRHEHAGYGGEKFVTMEIDLEGSQGFNKGHTYNIELSQVGPKDQNLKLAEGKLTLKYTAPQEQPEGDTEGEGDEEGDTEAPADTAEQDAIDTLIGGQEAGADDGPPPVEPKKKGCAVDAAAYGVPGVLVLFAIGATRSRKKKTRG